MFWRIKRGDIGAAARHFGNDGPCATLQHFWKDRNHRQTELVHLLLEPADSGQKRPGKMGGLTDFLSPGFFEAPNSAIPSFAG
jgi:hypothetical protein